MALEIERKYLLEVPYQHLVDQGIIAVQSEQRIEQTYIALDEDQELRVRRIKDLATGAYEYTHTFKNGVGLAREEVEYSITQVIYDQLIAACGYVPLTKNRITATWNNTTVEIDVYDQVNFIVVEVEFASMEEADSFAPPSWFGEEISFNKTYSNKSVWRQLQQSSQQ